MEIYIDYIFILRDRIAAEEIFVNIASYAYAPDSGTAAVHLEVSGEPSAAITFMDQGMPYNPLAKSDPDVTLPADAGEIGGLGIFMTKKLMDDVTCARKGGRNILTIKKASIGPLMLNSRLFMAFCQLSGSASLQLPA